MKGSRSRVWDGPRACVCLFVFTAKVLFCCVYLHESFFFLFCLLVFFIFLRHTDILFILVSLFYLSLTNFIPHIFHTSLSLSIILPFNSLSPPFTSYILKTTSSLKFSSFAYFILHCSSSSNPSSPTSYIFSISFSLKNPSIVFNPSCTISCMQLFSSSPSHNNPTFCHSFTRSPTKVTIISLSYIYIFFGMCVLL